MRRLFGAFLFFCLENLVMMQDDRAIYTLDGHMLEYEIDISIPQCGSVNQALYKVLDFMKAASICEVLQDAFQFVAWKWQLGYVGCHEDFQVIWNGTVKLYFFLKRIDASLSDDCLSTSATNFNQLIQKGLNILGTRFSGIIRTKRAAIRRNVVVYRLAFRYPTFKLKEMKHYTWGERISHKNQTRFKMEQCSKKELRKLMPNSRLFTHWFPGLPSFHVTVHIWLNGSEEKNVEENIRNLFTECIDNLERATVFRVDLEGWPEIQCQPSDRADNGIIENTTEISRNGDEEFIIPCFNEDERTTSSPVNSSGATHLSETISDSTTTEYNSARWNRKFLIWTILSSVMLCYQ